MKYILDKPSKITCQHMKILYRQNALSQSRLGIVISKQVVRLAVDRNRVRRIIRESFRLHQADMGAFDMIIIVTKSVSKDENKVLRNEVDNIWTRL